MAELELEAYTLGQKHQHYNRLVRNAIESNKIVNIEDFNLEDCDTINLLNIDIASHRKNVEYILKVLTCNDMLYVSRAIKQSDWLINDQNYAHIINPKYCRTTLFPQMSSKAIIKLIKYMRNNLNDEKRAEEFYSHEDRPEEAVKWLTRCSLEFIKKNLLNHVQHIKTSLLKRLCEKSITVLEIYIKNVETYKARKALQVSMFLLPSNTDKFLDMVEDTLFPQFNKKATTILMKNSSNRIIDKFDKYYNAIHLPTFVKCLKRSEIKDFLLTQAQNIKENKFYRFCNLSQLLLFIRTIPEEIRFEFVEEVFINKTHELKHNCGLSEKQKIGMSMLCDLYDLRNINHIWYQFAPFNLALQKIQELIGSASSTRDKISMLETLLTSSQNKVSHERTFLEYLRDKKKNIDNKVKEEILKKLLLKNNFLKYDINTWNVLDDIFKDMDTYNETKTSESLFIEAVIIYNIIHQGKIPERVKNKFQFNSLVSYHKKLAENEKEMVFVFLYDLIMAKIAECKPTKESEFKEKINTLELVLNLLKDYKKSIQNNPTLICTIKDLLKIKNDESWTTGMEKLYNIEKTWRKLFFKESLALCQTESVLLNVLKHDPSLLDQNKNIVNDMLCSDKMPLRQVLEKIKTYWPSNLAKNIIITYTEKLNGLGEHKAVTRGLSILLPPRHLQELITKYTPKEGKIDWAKIDEVELSVQQQFAKNMHISRPQPSPEIILHFAKGDYLQYALPSLLSIFYNLNELSSQTYILKLLDAPVSLQKHGIRLAVSKLKSEQLLYEFSNIWKNNKNASIRSVMFKTVHSLICKEKDSHIIKIACELMEIFIDNFTFQEDKAMYKLLFKVEKIPLEVRGRFYTKSYEFLHKLIDSSDEYKDYEHEFYTTFTAYSAEIIEELQPDFVVEIILQFVAKEFTKRETEVWSRGCVITIIAGYLLCATDEQMQLSRYKKVLLPILKQSFALWNTEHFIRYNLSNLLNTLRCNICKYVKEKKKVNPHKMFSLIQEELQTTLEPPANYIFLTKWKLTVTFISMLDVHYSTLTWEETCIKVSRAFGIKCKDYLKEDCIKHFPRIYLLFVKALKSMLSDFIPESANWDIYRGLICDKSFVQGFLAAILLISDVHQKDNNFEALCESICKHPSIEIKMHFYNQIKIKSPAQSYMPLLLK